MAAIAPNVPPARRAREASQAAVSAVHAIGSARIDCSESPNVAQTIRLSQSRSGGWFG